jgi:hypothetical protein
MTKKGLIVKHINLDREDERIKRFVRSLPIDPDGSVLEINGEPVVRVLPVVDEPVDDKMLREAIRNRRTASRMLNKEWEAVDRETWERVPDDK